MVWKKNFIADALIYYYFVLNAGRSSIDFHCFQSIFGLINLLDDDDNNNLMLEIMKAKCIGVKIYWVDILRNKELFETEFMKTENFIIHLILVRGSPVILIANSLMTLDDQNNDFRQFKSMKFSRFIISFETSLLYFRNS